MLNKHEFTNYAETLLASCDVTHRGDGNTQVTYFSKDSEAEALAAVVFSTQESNLTFTKGGIDIGSMILSIPVSTSSNKPSDFVYSSDFTCLDVCVPNMRHFVKSDDTEQENRASITKYLAVLLQDYSLTFGDDNDVVVATYNDSDDRFELANNLFNCKTSCISINKDGEQLGSIHFAGEHNEKLACAEGEPYDFLDVYAYSSNQCRALLPNKVVAN